MPYFNESQLEQSIITLLQEQGYDYVKGEDIERDLDGVVLRIGLSVLLGIYCGFGIFGFWYGHALAGFTPFFIGIVYFTSGRWRTRKYIIGRKSA